MDCSILEGDPHCVIEGLAICALAIGAKEGFLYIRDEYIFAQQHMQKAIEDAEKGGFLGDSIMGSDKSLKLEIVRGGGAFVCGESTALVSSIEGKIGEPRAKYIRTVEKGLFGQPTVLNNVETLANVPFIIKNSGAKFTEIGTKKSPGTKVFALVGKVKRTGLVEVPMGITLRELIFGIGGGVIGDRPFKCVQTGGPSGGCLPEGLLDTAVDFDSLTEHGSMMGSGGMIVTDDRTCIVEFAKYYANFLTGESCGKCTPCREGLRKLTAILSDICEGKGLIEDLELIENICETMETAALCGLGKSAPNPVMTTLKHFREEYEEHIKEKRCRAGICQALSRFDINGEKCNGCGVCKKACPVSAIEGEKKKVHVIKQELCFKCGACRDVCKFDAVSTMG
jgi:NADH-quinone oxidoreductase subunit F